VSVQKGLLPNRSPTQKARRREPAPYFSPSEKAATAGQGKAVTASPSTKPRMTHVAPSRDHIPKAKAAAGVEISDSFPLRTVDPPTEGPEIVTDYD
jgi:hypothetical protein